MALPLCTSLQRPVTSRGITFLVGARARERREEKGKGSLELLWEWLGLADPRVAAHWRTAARWFGCDLTRGRALCPGSSCRVQDAAGVHLPSGSRRRPRLHQMVFPTSWLHLRKRQIRSSYGSIRMQVTTSPAEFTALGWAPPCGRLGALCSRAPSGGLPPLRPGSPAAGTVSFPSTSHRVLCRGPGA